MPDRQRLELKQSHTLALTPQLQQSIKLLQCSSLELAAFITEALETNPLLTRAETEEAPAPPEPDASDGFEENFAGAWESLPSRAYNDNPFEAAHEAPLSLKEHITAQVNLIISTPSERIIAQHLVDLLEDNGYITADFSSLAALLGCAEADILAVLERLQSLDPPGVFARSAAECLSLQLKDRDSLTPAMAMLLAHLDLLAKGELKLLQKHCGVDEAGLKSLIKAIKSLNPKPGANFHSETVQPIQPDVFLKKINGNWVVSLNSEALPKLLLNYRYVNAIENSKGADKKYLTDQASAANWLIKTLDQRAQTILKVASEIVTHQHMFFDHGVKYLKPLTLAAIAAATGLHESTVSRVTANKYLATPSAVFELKYFFSSAIQDDSGAEFSSRSVKFLIQELIENETNVLSDDAIATLLNDKGLDIARRTVAKYREALGLPTSAERKRGKRI